MKYLPVVAALLMIASCRKAEKEIAVIAPPPPHWRADSSIQYEDKRILNAVVRDSRLFLFQPNGGTAIDTTGKVRSYYSLPYLNPGIRTPTDGHYVLFASYSDQIAEVADVSSTIVSGGYRSWQTSIFTDTPLQTLSSHLFYYSYQPIAAFAGQNMLCFSTVLQPPPYHPASYADTTRLRLFSWNNSSGAIPPASQKVVDIIDSFAALPMIYSTGSAFLVAVNTSTHNRLVKVDTTGAQSAVPVAGQGRTIYALFSYKGDLCLVTGEGIIISKDGGGHFTDLYAGHGLFESFRGFYVIGDRIIMATRGYLAEVTLSSGTASLRPLNCEGLAGNTITSVQQLGNKVYAATLSGLYYTAADSVFNTQ